MTIRRNINIEDALDAYRAFREAIESAPEGVFERAKEINGFLDQSFFTMESLSSAYDLTLDKSDNMFEIETIVFDMLRRNNPNDEIESAIGFGRTLLDYPESRERVIAGLERDRDFIRSVRERANDFVPGVDDQYDREMPA